MMDLHWWFEFSFLIAEAVLGVVGILIVCSSDGLKKELKRIYLVTILLLTLLALLQVAFKLIELDGGKAHLDRYDPILLHILYLPLYAALTAYLIYLCGEPLRRSRALWLVLISRALLLLEMVVFVALDLDYAALELSSVPAIVSLVLGIAAFAVQMVVLIRRWKKLTAGQRVLFVFAFLFLERGMLLILELLILREQNRQYRKQQQELIREKTSVAVLQMRPHFISNTLLSIYYLCQEDREKAEQAILDFNTYLQANFTAIVSEDCIPFSKELEHTQAYLAVEKIRFAGRLFVELDTPVAMFHLPPLTLQPIVENAVKYGVSADRDPLQISVRTELKDGAVWLTVEDTGPGYDPARSSEPHFALENIRERLKMMCGGTLEIARRPAGGTKVTIRLPQPGTAKGGTQ